MDRHNIMVYLSVEADTAEQAKQKVQDILQMVSRADVLPTCVLVDKRQAIKAAIQEDEEVAALVEKKLVHQFMEEALAKFGDPATWEADKIALEKKNATRRLPVCQQCGFHHPGGSCWDS